MPVSIGLIAQTIEKIAPKSWAEEWDNVGLLVGNFSTPVERVLLTLDATPNVLQEAKERGVQLIIAHHPILFRPLKNLRSDNQAAQLPIQLIQSGIAYYAAHTNLDQSSISSSWGLGAALGLQKMDYLSLTEPAFDLNPLRNNGLRRGYGVVGNLSQPQPLSVLERKVLEGLRILAPEQIKQEPAIRIAGDTNQLIRKIAIVNGSGGSFIPKALFKGADLIITGDVDHHGALDALEAGMAVMDIGHFWSEVPMIKTLTESLKADKGLSEVEILMSQCMHSPWVVK